MRTLLIKFRGDRTQNEMAEKYGVTQQAWSKWECGIGAPKPQMMKRLEIDSGIKMEELFFDVFNNCKLLNLDNKASINLDRSESNSSIQTLPKTG